MEDEDGGGISTIITFALKMCHMLSTLLPVFYSFVLYTHDSIMLLLSPPLSSEKIEA